MRDESTNSSGQKKWWYQIAVMIMICIFFVGIDVVQNGRITWSVWPVAAVLFFGVGFTLLNKFGRE
ncbi:MAG: 2TM domain-containing protein [Methanoregula sp.]|nr:2TM domain-containing protein [Methanoregula sp.]